MLVRYERVVDRLVKGDVEYQTRSALACDCLDVVVVGAR